MDSLAPLLPCDSEKRGVEGDGGLGETDRDAETDATGCDVVAVGVGGMI